MKPVHQHMLNAHNARHEHRMALLKHHGKNVGTVALMATPLMMMPLAAWAGGLTTADTQVKSWVNLFLKWAYWGAIVGVVIGALGWMFGQIEKRVAIAIIVGSVIMGGAKTFIDAAGGQQSV